MVLIYFTLAPIHKRNQNSNSIIRGIHLLFQYKCTTTSTSTHLGHLRSGPLVIFAVMHSISRLGSVMQSINIWRTPLRPPGHRWHFQARYLKCSLESRIHGVSTQHAIVFCQRNAISLEPERR